MAAPCETSVDLGFVEEDSDPRLLKGRFFPSKLGGKPAWLSLSNLPNPESLQCPICEKQLVFLLQIYSPRDEHDYAFHRTIFVFMCRNPTCCKQNSNKNFKVFRSQLARENDFYSTIPPDERHPDRVPEGTREVVVALCEVCGSLGPKRCGKCHTISYCGRQHQTLHWKGGHKKKCGQDSKDADLELPNVLFPQAELVMEEENLPKDMKSTEKSETEKLQEYREFLQANREKGSASLGGQDLEQSAVSESADDKQFAKFKERIAVSPDQVLRYDRGGTPLWISVHNHPTSTDIPACKCGAQRQFEFQVLPQLLIHLKVDSIGDSIDWGTLCIYTCSQSCDISNNYHEEFLWKQDIPVDKSES